MAAIISDLMDFSFFSFFFLLRPLFFLSFFLDYGCGFLTVNFYFFYFLRKNVIYCREITPFDGHVFQIVWQRRPFFFWLRPPPRNNCCFAPFIISSKIINKSIKLTRLITSKTTLAYFHWNPTLIQLKSKLIDLIHKISIKKIKIRSLHH